jgi:ribosomal protein S18 acetylase RimI-like enzyme
VTCSQPRHGVDALDPELVDALRVEVFAPNDRARKFYERLGYVPRDIDQIKLLEQNTPREPTP